MSWILLSKLHDEIKNISNTKIISNGSADISICSDAIYFDNYKLWDII